MGEQLTYGYVGDIVKSVPQEDGSLMVYGVATSARVDLDGQACDPKWLQKAMPKWFEFGNVREQHSNIAAGVGVEMSEDESGRWWLKTRVVDRGTIAKVEAGVLKGYSIGVRNGQVMRGKAAAHAPNGVICGGDVAEVSLVDRPCNPDGSFTINKSFSGEEGPAEHVVLGSLLDEHDDAGVPSDDVDDETADSQGVDSAVDGDDELDADAEDGLTLFDEDELDDEDEDEDEEPQAVDSIAGLSKVLSATADGGTLVITKGVLDMLLNGPGKRDGDGDGKTGEGKKKSNASALAARRRQLRAARERERADARKHRNMSDAEHAQDSARAGKQGRKLEQAQHARRMGTYTKAVEAEELTSGLSAAEHREAQRLMRDVLAGDIVKSVSAEPAELEADAEAVAVLAELVISEAEQLALGDFDDDHDPHLLLDAVAAVAKMLGASGRTITKSAGSVVDTSPTDSATVITAEIVKAQIAEATQALQSRLIESEAQLAKILATPQPGAAMVMKPFQPLTPALPPAQKLATEYASIAARPDIAPDVAAAYRAAAREAGDAQG